MKKFITKGLSLVLSTIIIFSVVPIAKAAEEDTHTIDSGESDFVIENSSLGAIINDTIEEQETDSSEYYIKYMEVYGDVAVIDLFCVQSCTLVVAVFTEEGKMVGSGTINVEPNITGDINTEYVDLTVDSMPEYFVAKAFLLDENNAALCKEYTCKLYTKAYQEFLSKTIYDFPDNTVVNLDKETDNNFAVLEDGAIRVDSDENKNDLVSFDEQAGTYVFENADSILGSVENGDTVYVDTNDDNCIVIKVKDIETVGEKTVITAESDIEISDLFTYIKIDATAQADADSVDTSEMDEGVEYLGGYEASEPASTYSSRAIDESVKIAFPFELKKSFKTPDGTIVSIKGGAEISVEGHLKFDFDEKNRILDILYETSVGLILNASVSLEVKNTIRLGFPKFELPICTGVTISGTPKIVFSGKAVVEVENAKYFYKIGFSYDTANGKKNINEKNTDWEPKFESKMELTIGLEFKLSGELIGTLKLSVDFTAGIKLVINILAMNDYNDVGEKHMCSPCMDGDVDFYFSVKAGVSVGLPAGLKLTLLEVTFANITMDLFDFYYSLGDKGIGFGFGECKNYVNEHKTHTHTLTGWQTTVYPTCTKTGTKIKKCTSCGVVVNKETISKTGHSTGSWITTLQPTCVKEGVRIKKCSACKAVVSKEYIAKSGHKEGAWETIKTSTCVEKGTRIKKCTVCSVTLKSEELPLGNHSLPVWTFTADTETGESIGIATCSLCGETAETQNGILTFTLSEDGKSYILSDCIYGVEGEIIIPSVFNGKPVTSIGGNAFYYCESLTSITIPDSVTSIGYWAFAYCYPLTSITIPDSVTSIGDYAFAYCNSLTSIVVDSANEYYSNDEYGVLFNKVKTELIQYPIGNTRTGYSIPDSVTSIGVGAFADCNSLSITIPDSVTSIGGNAFYHCESLTSITIPDSVTSIGEGAFYYCSSLTSITIPDSVTSIGEGAFYWCSSLTSITVDSANKYYSNDEYGVLFNKVKTELIQYPIGNTRTGYSIPDSVTSIGGDAFCNCNSLTSITIPDSVTSIGEGAFDNCTSLTSITIPDGVANIGDYAFNYCDSLTSITIPDSVTSIGYRAFSLCRSLTDVYYCGTEERWNAITIESGNEELKDATIHYNFVPYDVASFDLLSAMAVDYASDNVFTATASKAIIGNEYVLLVLKQSEGEIDLSAENLCYIAQKNASDTTISFEFIPKSDDFAMVVIVGDFGQGTETIVANEWKPKYTIDWNIEGKVTSQTVSIGSQIISPTDPIKTGYTFIGWTPFVPEIMPSENLTFTAVFEANSYDAVFNANGGAWSDGATEKTISVKFGEEITTPETPEKQGYKFIKWENEIPETMPANDLTFTAVFELSFDMNIRMPSTNIIKYGDSITLHADLNGELPSNWRIEWSADNGNFDYSVSADGRTCTITPSKSGKTMFTVTVFDAEVNIISSDTQVMTSKAGFFDKLIAFFREIFGLLKDYEQAINVMF